MPDPVINIAERMDERFQGTKGADLAKRPCGGDLDAFVTVLERK